MTREKREQLINYLKYNREINSDFVFTDEDVDMIIEALSTEPCKNAVSRTAVIKAIKDWWSTVMMAQGKPTLCEDIKALPSVKVEPKMAEWIVNKDLNGRIQCSACGMFLGLTEEDLKEGYWLSKYCSNCGAKMKGGEE